MTVQLYVNPGDDAPIYRQIVRQVIDGIATGRIRPGERLPSQRELGQALVISPLTVKKAYDELERDGYLRTARGQGTFVREDAPRRTGPERLERLRGAVRQLVVEAAVGGLSYDELLALLDEEQRRVRSEEEDR